MIRRKELGFPILVFVILLISTSSYALSFSIFIENEYDGRVKVLENGKWIECGRIASPAIAFNEKPFTASQWGKLNSVVASAVNAIHIMKKEGILSVLPKEAFSSGARSRSSIVTDILPQKSIFGGGYSPFVGSDVIFHPSEGIPKLLEIRVFEEKSEIVEIIFENKVGGNIIACYLSGEEKIIGKVIKPVEGVGRFVGSEYTGVGRIRANHPGVICISTSSLGEIGGFQIIPYRHSLSPEMIKVAWNLTQWMIVDPDPGTFPLFSGVILPNWDPYALEKPDWEELLLRRSLVMVKFEGDKDWRFFKELTGRDDVALRGLKYVKILLPFIKQEVF
ncbi:MAG: hypothetical protein N3C62_00870 [Synergistetes bacterium]|nr:hypothetical protein [Synergistota bacterium]MCX8127290.1 hypothetical protein [Synergistota bacterium]MDW8191824.1 hypothetical protein [Synergistota bacterium]